jgi:hypothetical protein
MASKGIIGMEGRTLRSLLEEELLLLRQKRAPSAVLHAG